MSNQYIDSVVVVAVVRRRRRHSLLFIFGALSALQPCQCIANQHVRLCVCVCAERPLYCYIGTIYMYKCT